MNMKTINSMLVLHLICVVAITGCGVSQSEHQRAEKELQQTKQKSADDSAKLDDANQKIASLNSSLAVKDKTIQDLNDSINVAVASNTQKNATIDRLMNLEEFAFADAEVADKAGDNTKTLVAYKAFVRDFPFSSKASLAQDKINAIQQIFSNQAKEEADKRRRAVRQAAAQARAAQFDEERKNLRSMVEFGIVDAQTFGWHLKGKSQSEITALLGQPASMETGDYGRTTWTYNVLFNDLQLKRPLKVNFFSDGSGPSTNF